LCFDSEGLIVQYRRIERGVNHKRAIERKMCKDSARIGKTPRSPHRACGANPG